MTLHGEVIDSGQIEARVKYEPYGVVAIPAFNWPPLRFSKKTASAIAAGNTVVIKPGGQAPLVCCDWSSWSARCCADDDADGHRQGCGCGKPMRPGQMP